MELLVKLLVAGGIMGVMDYLWLGIISKKLYYSEMGKILLDKPNMAPALLFYVIYVVGVLVFVVNPALAKDSWMYAAGMGAFFGLIAFATYDLTNLATMKGFSAKIVVIDLLWGACMTAVVATGTYFIVKSLF